MSNEPKNGKKVSRWKKNFWHSKGDQIFQTFRYGLWLLISATTFSITTLSIAALYIELHYGECHLWVRWHLTNITQTDIHFGRQPIWPNNTSLTDEKDVILPTGVRYQFDWQIFQTFHFCMWLLISATTFSIMTLSIAAIYIELHVIYGCGDIWPTALRLTVTLADSPFDQTIPVWLLKRMSFYQQEWSVWLTDFPNLSLWFVASDQCHNIQHYDT
jgi:hypothetical protein